MTYTYINVRAIVKLAVVVQKLNIGPNRPTFADVHARTWKPSKKADELMS